MYELNATNKKQNQTRQPIRRTPTCPMIIVFAYAYAYTYTARTHTHRKLFVLRIIYVFHWDHIIIIIITHANERRCDDVTMVNYLLSTNIRLYRVLYCWCWCSVVVVIFVLIFFGACTYVRRTNLWLFANKNKDWNASYSSKWDIILTMDLIFARSKLICVSLHNIPPHMCGAAAYSEAFKHRLARKNTEFTNAEWICKALVVSNSNLTDESRLITMKKQRINTFGRVIIHVSMNTV